MTLNLPLKFKCVVLDGKDMISEFALVTLESGDTWIALERKLRDAIGKSVWNRQAYVLDSEGDAIEVTSNSPSEVYQSFKQGNQVATIWVAMPGIRKGPLVIPGSRKHQSTANHYNQHHQEASKPTSKLSSNSCDSMKKMQDSVLEMQKSFQNMIDVISEKQSSFFAEIRQSLQESSKQVESMIEQLQDDFTDIKAVSSKQQELNKDAMESMYS